MAEIKSKKTTSNDDVPPVEEIFKRWLVPGTSFSLDKQLLRPIVFGDTGSAVKKLDVSLTSINYGDGYEKLSLKRINADLPK